MQTIRRIQRGITARCLGGWRNYRRAAHVVMFHVGRSGSTVLSELLSQQGNIGWAGELFQQQLEKFAHDDSTLPPMKPIDPLRYMHQRAAYVHKAIYGFELKFFHLRLLGMNPQSFLDAIDRSRTPIQIIVLERRNTLRKVISSVIARQFDVWHLSHDRKTEPRSVNIDVNAVFVDREYRVLRDLLDEYAQDFTRLKATLASRDYLQLYYEDDVMNAPKSAYYRVCDYLYIPANDVQVTRTRINPFPLSEIVQNLDEVRAHLALTPHAWMTEV